jgi:Leucine-rich repeat (LRR) protein
VPHSSPQNSFSALATLQKGWTVEGDYKIHSDLQYADIRRWRRLKGMKQILVMMAAVVLVGCSDDKRKTAPKKAPLAEEKAISIADPIVEKAIRESLKKFEGQLTETDLGKVTSLNFNFNKITDEGIKEVAKLQQLEWLFLEKTQITDKGLKEVAKLQKLTILNLYDTKTTKAGVAELKKALPNCNIIGR